MLFNLPDIGGKDWYRWGAEGLITNQKKDGWWPDAALEKRRIRRYASIELLYAPPSLFCSSSARIP